MRAFALLVQIFRIVVFTLMALFFGFACFLGFYGKYVLAKFPESLRPETIPAVKAMSTHFSVLGVTGILMMLMCLTVWLLDRRAKR